ncbi:MAG: hypothetical protein E7266_10560 [Lachnospiraceae bacterium]|nr:hypothetical protein [Lachnospiraceae bacterium]
MVRGQEVPLNVKEYIKNLKPVEDFKTLKKGDKIFNKQSLNISYIDTFISYNEEKDIVEYENHIGEIWCGAGRGYWYFVE